jgi:putative ATPase
MNEPLAERLRPRTLDDYLSQQHLIGENGALNRQIKSGNIPSLILWGPPGVGKTTLANIIATESGRPFYTLSAINSGVKDVREIIEKPKRVTAFLLQRTQYFLLMRSTGLANPSRTLFWEQ